MWRGIGVCILMVAGLTWVKNKEEFERKQDCAGHYQTEAGNGAVETFYSPSLNTCVAAGFWRGFADNPIGLAPIDISEYWLIDVFSRARLYEAKGEIGRVAWEKEKAKLR